MSVFVVVRRRVVRRARRVPGIVQNVLAQPFRFLCFSSQRSPSYQILGSRFVVAFSSGKASRRSVTDLQSALKIVINLAVSMLHMAAFSDNSRRRAASLSWLT
eukprot:s180_g29.t1